MSRSTTTNGRNRASSSRSPAAGLLIAANSAASPSCWRTRTAAPSRCTARGRGYGRWCRSTTVQVTPYCASSVATVDPDRPTPHDDDGRVRHGAPVSPRWAVRGEAAWGLVARGVTDGRALRRRDRRGGTGRFGGGVAGAAGYAPGAGCCCSTPRRSRATRRAATGSPRTSSTSSTHWACAGSPTAPPLVPRLRFRTATGRVAERACARPNRVIRREGLRRGARRRGGGPGRTVAPPSGQDAGGAGRPGRARRVVAARTVVGADGANSVVRRLLGAPAGPPRSTALAIRGYAPSVLDPGALMIEFADGPYPAYAWSFPVADGGANVGYGCSTGEGRQPPGVPRRPAPPAPGTGAAPGDDPGSPPAAVDRAALPPRRPRAAGGRRRVHGQPADRGGDLRRRRVGVLAGRAALARRRGGCAAPASHAALLRPSPPAQRGDVAARSRPAVPRRRCVGGVAERPRVRRGDRPRVGPGDHPGPRVRPS